MISRSCTQERGRAQGSAKIALSLSMLIVVSVGGAYAQTKSPTAAWTDARVPETAWVKAPKKCNRDDARIVVDVARVTGGYVSLAKLKLFQIEGQKGEEGGGQSMGANGTFVTRLRGCAPNPFARGTSVSYELGSSGPVALTVSDVSGRLVRRLESGPRQAGLHVACWDGADGRGRAVPAGVYFVRFCAGEVVSTGRLTLVR
jgi:hypothetical protein